jgi:hypothetical protein
MGKGAGMLVISDTQVAEIKRIGVFKANPGKKTERPHLNQ